MRVRGGSSATGAFPRWPGAAIVAAALAGLLMSATTCARRPAAIGRPIEDAVVREPLLRVRVARAVDSISIVADSSIRLAAAQPGDRRPASVISAPVTLSLERRGFTAQDERGGARLLPFRDRLRVSAGGDVLVDGVRHRGRVTLHRAGGDDSLEFDVVVEVLIEDYLTGVVSSELYPGWGDAAHEAQAVAARSYAMHERERRRSLGSHFDLENTTVDQAYNGASATADARRAVERTRGLALTHPGGVLRAYYSSTCGGRPASAADTWPTSSGYEFNLATPIQAAPRACPCDFSPRYRWSVRRDRAELARRLAAFGADRGRSLRRLRSLSLLTTGRRNAAGRPAEYTVYDRDGRWWALSAEDLRLALNYTEERRGLSRPQRDAAAWSGDVDVEIRGDAVAIRGRGFGHGVGMCQFGAEGMDREGADAFEILAHYYPGARVRRLY